MGILAAFDGKYERQSHEPMLSSIAVNCSLGLCNQLVEEEIVLVDSRV